MKYNDTQANKLSNESPGLQVAQVGSHIKELEDYAPVIFYKAITADATGGVNVFSSLGTSFQFEIIDITVQARAASASGTALLSDGTNSISDAIIMAVDTVITRAGTLDDTYTTILVGEQLVITTNGAADRGLVTIKARKLS